MMEQFEVWGKDNPGADGPLLVVKNREEYNAHWGFYTPIKRLPLTEAQQRYRTSRRTDEDTYL